ncbi:MAG: GNAT family N-acetyltransferase [Pseudomonadota bacterium]
MTPDKSARPATPLSDRLNAGELFITGKDGNRYKLRHIQLDDAPSLMRGYDALSERGKWFRMLHAVPHLTDEMAEGFCSPDPETGICLVIEGHDSLAGEIIGGARLAEMGPGARAEFSVSTRPETRGLGLARQALETVMAIGWERGCREIWGLISARNQPMLGLAERIGFDLRRDPDDATLIIAEIKPPPPTAE